MVNPFFMHLAHRPRRLRQLGTIPP